MKGIRGDEKKGQRETHWQCSQKTEEIWPKTLKVLIDDGEAAPSSSLLSLPASSEFSFKTEKIQRFFVWQTFFFLCYPGCLDVLLLPWPQNRQLLSLSIRRSCLRAHFSLLSSFCPQMQPFCMPLLKIYRCISLRGCLWSQLINYNGRHRKAEDIERQVMRRGTRTVGQRESWRGNEEM